MPENYPSLDLGRFPADVGPDRIQAEILVQSDRPGVYSLGPVQHCGMRPFRASMAGLVCALAVLAGCGGDSGGDSATDLPSTTATTAPAQSTTTTTSSTTTTAAPVAELAINHVQVVGSHNSYHLKPDQALFDALAALAPALAESIEYSHRPLTEQLETFGIRQFEIDVHADPDGSLFTIGAADALVGLADSADPALSQPGFNHNVHLREEGDVQLPELVV